MSGFGHKAFVSILGGEMFLLGMWPEESHVVFSFLSFVAAFQLSRFVSLRGIRESRRLHFSTHSRVQAQSRVLEVKRQF